MTFETALGNLEKKSGFPDVFRIMLDSFTLFYSRISNNEIV